jgi:hypothetical protein
MVMTTMMKQVHQRARSQYQIRQRTQDMRSVFGKEKVSGNHEKKDQDDAGPSSPPGLAFDYLLVLMHGVVHWSLSRSSGAWRNFLAVFNCTV